MAVPNYKLEDILNESDSDDDFDVDGPDNETSYLDNILKDDEDGKTRSDMDITDDIISPSLEVQDPSSSTNSSHPVPPDGSDTHTSRPKDVQNSKPTIAAPRPATPPLVDDGDDDDDDIEALVGRDDAGGRDQPYSSRADEALLDKILDTDSDDDLNESATRIDELIGDGDSKDESLGAPEVLLQEASDAAGDQGLIAQAQALEHRLSTLGNHNMITPLSATRKANQDRTYNIIRLLPLLQVTEKLSKYRSQFGMPTSLATHHKLIAVGTFGGVVLIFDYMQKLAMVLGQIPEARERGPVTTLDIAPNGDFLVVGHEAGTIVFWDILNKTVLKKISDSFKAPITSVRFTRADKHAFVAKDTMGNVKIFSLARIFFSYSVDEQLLLDGRAGPIFAQAMLISNPKFRHPCDAHGLLALGNAIEVLIVALEPNPRILYRIPRPVDEAPELAGKLPFVSWRRMEVGDADAGLTAREREIRRNPVLCIARGRTIQLISVTVRGRQANEAELSNLPPGTKRSPNSPLLMSLVGSLTLQHERVSITGAEWLSGQIILLTTDRDELLVIDPLEMRHLETRTIKTVGLVFHQRFQNKATGQQEMSYHNSIRANPLSMLLVGVHEVQEARMLSWSDRVDAVVRKSKWMEALALALDFFEGKATASVGLPRDTKALRNLLEDKVVNLLKRYVELAMGDVSAKASTHHFKIVGGVSIEYCVAIDRSDVLFRHIYTKFKAFGAEQVFLELLEPYILNDKLTLLNTEIFKEFVELYRSKGRLQRVEQCILHMNVGCLDFQQVVKLCRDHGLFSAIIYMFNKGCSDYCLPLEELLKAILNPTSKFSQSAKKSFVLKMFLYLHSCFLGLAFPNGAIPPGEAPKVKRSLVRFIFDKSPKIPEVSTDKPYPVLQHLLHTNTKEFLQVLSLLFASEEWEALADLPDQAEVQSRKRITRSAADPRAQRAGQRPPAQHPPQQARQPDRGWHLSNLFKKDEPAPPAGTPPPPPYGPPPAHQPLPAVPSMSDPTPREPPTPSKQDLFEILIEVMVDESVDPYEVTKIGHHSNQPWSLKEMVEFFKFASRFLARGIIECSANFLNRTFAYLSISTTVESISEQKSLDDRQERQEMLLELLKTADTEHYDTDKLIRHAEQAKLFKVCAYLYKQSKDYVRVIDSFLLDASSLRVQVFDYITNIIEEAERLEDVEPIESVRVAILDEKRLTALVDTDAMLAARLIVRHYTRDNDQVIQILQPYKELQFRYMKALMNSSVDNGSLNMSDRSAMSMTELRNMKGLNLTPQMHETYVSRLCEFEPQSVYRHVVQHGNIDIPKILKLCTKYEINDATAYLLERTGRVEEALRLTLQTVQKRMQLLQARFEKSLNSPDEERRSSLSVPASPEETQVKDIVEVAIRICEENSRKEKQAAEQSGEAPNSSFVGNESERLWFRLLDCFVKLERDTRAQLKRGEIADLVGNQLQSAIYSFVRFVLDHMMKHVPLQHIMRKITDDHQHDPFREFRDTIQGMLDTYSYEKNIIQTANRLLAGDMSHAVDHLRRRHARAYLCRQDTCGSCSRSLRDDTVSQTLALFNCGHSFHQSCLQSSASSRRSTRNQFCPICSSKGTRSRKDPSAVQAEAGAERPKIERRQPFAVLKSSTPISNFEISQRIETGNTSALFRRENNVGAAAARTHHRRPDKTIGPRLPGALDHTPLVERRIGHDDLSDEDF